MSGTAKLIHNRNFAVLCTVEALLLWCATIWGMVDPAMSANREANAMWLWVWWVFLAGSACLGGRSWFVGASVDGEDLIKHGWFRTRRIPIAGIRRVETANYDGWASETETRMFRLVTLWLTSNKTIRLPELAGRPHTARALADDVARACGLPVPVRSTTGGRHRAS